jgi:8-oxo-dGTP pyrophosphatase MutT (NUDIX family)
MDYDLLSNKDTFLQMVIEKLGTYPIDYVEKINFIKSTRQSPEFHQAAGVLLLLQYKEKQFCFQLIKRSSKIAQAGDLSCPGGMLHAFIDPLLRPLVAAQVVPMFQKETINYARKRGNETFKLMTLFLTNASRESWEEIGLNPWNLLFLGPLPCYSLTLFRRTIFPLVGFVKKEWTFQTNSEVDKVIEIPLKAFFDPEKFCRYMIEAPDPINPVECNQWEYPCFTHTDHEGIHEILWGATFNIILSFLRIVLNYKLPQERSDRIYRKTIHTEYIKGRK